MLSASTAAGAAIKTEEGAGGVGGLLAGQECDHGAELGRVAIAAGWNAATPYGVTSLAKLGQMVTMPELDMALQAAFAEVLGD